MRTKTEMENLPSARKQNVVGKIGSPRSKRGRSEHRDGNADQNFLTELEEETRKTRDERKKPTKEKQE